MAKLDRPLDRFVLVFVVVPHGFEVSVEEPPVLFQSMAVPCVLYDGVIVGDAMLFILAPIAGLCCDCPKDGLPMPGFDGAMAGNAELSELNVLSGVIVLPTIFGAERFVCGGGDTGGLDQENVAAGDAFLVDPALTAGREGSIDDEEADVGAVAQGSAPPPNMSEPVFVPWLPRTRASKSASPAPFGVSKPLDEGRPPKLINSLREVAGALLAPNSCSFRVCSFSTRAESDLISVM
jgi:hypothetical protein